MNSGDRESSAELPVASADAQQREVNAEEWLSGLEEREERVVHREQVAGERHALADERERAAVERERIADERERLAVERERLADEREAYADERERRLNDLETRADAQARTFGVPTESVSQRALEAIARGRVLLAASAANLDRSEAAVFRQRARKERQQQDVAAIEHDDASMPREQATQPRAEDQTERLRQRFLAAAADLVRIEEHIAETHEHAHAVDPDKQARHLKIAQEAREAARHARMAVAHLEPRH